MNKCAVCGIESNDNVVCCSSCGATTYCYCPQCLNKGLEPYNALVGMGLFYEEINKTYRTRIAWPTLQYYGKTVEQFNKDVEENLNAYCEAMKQMEGNSNGNKELDETPF